MDFFDVIGICNSFDKAHTNQFARRSTKITVSSDSAIFKVMHSENGCVWAQVIELHGNDDIGLELENLHKLIDSKIRYDKIIVETDWLYPLPF